MSLQRVCVKFFAQSSPDFDDGVLIPIFHDWIRRGVPLGTLVDVADYRHVPDGPGVMLIAYEGNIALDRSVHRLGLMYQRKTAQPGDIARRIMLTVRHTLTACQLLEQDPRVKGRLQFAAGELWVIANDRLLVSNTDEGYGRLEPHVREVARALFGEHYALERVLYDPQERLAARLAADASTDINSLLDKTRTLSP